MSDRVPVGSSTARYAAGGSRAPGGDQQKPHDRKYGDDKMAMTNEQWRGHPHYKFDPFAGKIQPALLNSADIKRYVDKDCLIEQDDFDMKRLKTASYEMRFLGELHDWNTTKDGTLEPRCRKVCCGDAVKLPGNSIAYLWMKEKLLLPEYIAARFNLHISHVHKGILLGTGPLVDPGFFGSLLIPLHNLTNNDYELVGGEGLIWIEFTKLSEHEFWKSQENENPPDLKSFPHGKYIKDARGYLKKSDIVAKGGVQSAFRRVLEQAQSSAEIARKETKRFSRFYTIGGIAVVIAVVIALVSMIYGGYNLVTQVIKITDDVHNQIKLDGDEQSQRIDSVQDNIVDLEARINRYKDEISELKKQVKLMNEKQEADRKIAQ